MKILVTATYTGEIELEITDILCEDENVPTGQDLTDRITEWLGDNIHHLLDEGELGDPQITIKEITPDEA